MRRLATLALLLAAGGFAAASAPGRPAHYRVDAIFDNAKGIIPGQLVKTAGARVGEVVAVGLTSDFKARIELRVDGRFAPFRTDASCSIRPEGLIAENFVQCDPGSLSAPALGGRGRPTVGLAHNSEPVSLTDLFDIWNVPTRERLSVLLNELGAAGAGRGEDLNAILLRANPTLAQARRAIALVDSQRADLQRAVGDTDRAIAHLAARPASLQHFVDRAAALARITAAHSGPLADAVHRLPPLLGATRPALGRLDRFAAAGTPVLDDLRAAAPQLQRLLGDLRPLSGAGLPALRALRPALTRLTGTLHGAQPLTGRLRTFAAHANPTGLDFRRLAVNLRDRGFVEGLLTFSYYATAAQARFDATSHILPAHLLADNCSQYATAPVPGCSAWYPNGALRAVRRGARGHRRPAPPVSPYAAAPQNTAPAPAPAPPATAPSLAPTLPQTIEQTVSSALGALDGVLPRAARGPLDPLLGYLLR